jgi:hypothetical protein
MRNNLENSQPMLQSADSKESAVYARHNRPQVTFEQLNFKAKQREKQRVNHEKLEQKDQEKADIELEKDIQELETQIITNDNIEEFVELNYSGNKKAFEIAQKYLDKQTNFGRIVSETELKNKIEPEIDETNELSNEDKIKNIKEQLIQQGKSPKEILQTLIAKFENEEAVNTWMENWKNFLKLHQYAENKPPAERKAIQQIISKADFTAENSFDTALSEIQNSTEISTETKTDLQKQFGAANIQTVSGMDNALNQIKNQKKEIEKQIDSKKSEKESLQSEITDLEKELETLSPDDPKAEELKKKLAEKKKILEQTESEIENLEEEKPEKVSFELRTGFSAQLNPNGSRTINITDSNFAIQLPDNTLFMSRKNMLSINLAFTYKALNNVGMDSLFTPKLNNGEVPDKKQRLFSNQILQGLGYKTDVILSQPSINQLEKDLSKLKQKGSNTTGIEDLTTLGIWDNSTQEVNMSRLKSCLDFVRENRNRQIEFEDIKAQLHQ